MKKFYSLIAALLMTASVFAQAPEKMSYQAVIRNSSNNLVTSTTVGMQVSILQGSASGTPVYVETQTPVSNANGLVSIEIGAGTVVSGTFSSIDWANGPYFIQTETDPTGGTSYSITGVSQLLSVPYAMYATYVENDMVDDADSDSTNEYNQSVVLNGLNLETTDGGGTIITDLSPIVTASGSQWMLSGTNIYNLNSGNVAVGFSATPYHTFAVGKSDTTMMMGIGHVGTFNEVYSGGITFSEDLSYNGDCGLRIVHNGSTNSLYYTGGCTSFSDTCMRINRSGYTNIRNLRLGTSMENNSSLPLTVDGLSSFNGDVTITGNLNVTGNIAKGGGTFKIDHPLDPANKYLVHSFVESPEMMNIFSGNVATDPDGYAIVEMPDYFEAANKDFRYQLTVIGSFAQAIIKEKISGNKFVIQTNEPNIEVSWMVTAVRSDKYAEANRIVPVSEKELKGTYIHPELYNAPESTQENAVKAQMQAAETTFEVGADGQR